MYIGEASARSGASERAIRLYESLGLLLVRRSGRYRVYSESDVAFIRLIKEGQQLGIQLSEMVALKNGHNEFDWEAVNRLLADKQEAVRAEICALHEKEALIERYRSSISSCIAELDSDPGVRV